MVTAEMLKLLDTLGVNQPRPSGRSRDVSDLSRCRS
jgi:hypothetical protein